MSLSVLLLLLVLVLLLGGWFASALVQDTGYVLMVWQGWQVQTSVSFALLCVLAAAVLLVLLLALLSNLVLFRQRRRQRQLAEQRATQLQQMEQAALYAVLDAPQLAFAQLHAATSTVHQLDLLPLLQANQAINAALWHEADAALQRAPVQADELAMLLQIRLALAQQQPDVALPLLQFLHHAPPDGLRQQFEPAVTDYMATLWLAWAVQKPLQWLELTLMPPVHWHAAQWSRWLAAVLLALPEANHQQQHQLLCCFDQQDTTLQQEQAVAWVRLLCQLPEGQGRAWLLLNQVLSVRFEPTLLPYLMYLARDFALPLHDHRVDELLTQLVARYPGQPALCLAQARWLDALGQTAQADQWVQDWPSACMVARLNLLRELDRYPTLPLSLLWSVSCAIYGFGMIGAKHHERD